LRFSEVLSFLPRRLHFVAVAIAIAIGF